MGVLVLVGVLCSLAYTSAAVGKLPPTFKLCSSKSPSYSKCLDNAIESAVRDLKKGYPALNINPIEPLLITSLSIDRNPQANAPVALDLRFKNLSIEGITQLKVRDSKVDFIKSNSISSHGKLPKLVLTGQYEVSGKVLILPVTGNGPCRIVLDELEELSEIYFSDFTKHNRKYKRVENYRFKIEKVKKMTMKFENLFNGDKVLGENMNRFINDNWEELLKELQPAFEEALGIAFKDSAAKLFQKVPINEIFQN